MKNNSFVRGQVYRSLNERLDKKKRKKKELSLVDDSLGRDPRERATTTPTTTKKLEHQVSQRIDRIVDADATPESIVSRHESVSRDLLHEACCLDVDRVLSNVIGAGRRSITR